MEQISAAGERAELTSTWLSWADADYISARHLLLTDLLVQGANLSNTAIEKYLKTVLVLAGSPFRKVHDVCTLYQQLRRTGINPRVNQEYLGVLVKAYELRYPDLDPGYNIYLNRTKLLVALDETVYEMRKGFKLARRGGEATTRVDLCLKEGSKLLLEKNCFFGGHDRQQLFAEESTCYELRVVGTNRVQEATCRVPSIPDDGIFNITTFGPGTDGKTFRLVHRPSSNT